MEQIWTIALIAQFNIGYCIILYIYTCAFTVMTIFTLRPFRCGRQNPP